MPVLGVVARRAVTLVPTLVLASLLVFALIHLVPGDPALVIAGDQATPEQLALIRERLGLDQPFLRQYIDWAGSAITGDLGRSLHTGEAVTTAILRTLPVTLHLVVGGILVAVGLGVPAGFLAARRPGTWIDSVVGVGTSFGVAVPSFWLGLILVNVFALWLGWLPATGFRLVTDGWTSSLRHLALPAIALGLVGAGELARQTRSAVLAALQSDSVRTLRALGVSEATVVFVHAGRNAAVPLLTVLGLQVTRLLGATVVVEVVFGIPGMGSLAVAATFQKDLAVIQGMLLAAVAVVMVTNVVVDIAYRLVDPRLT